MLLKLSLLISFVCLFYVHQCAVLRNDPPTGLISKGTPSLRPLKWRRERKVEDEGERRERDGGRGGGEGVGS